MRAPADVAGVAVGLVGGRRRRVGDARLLYDVKGHDPLTFVLAPLVLALAAWLACYLPARRAARISPLPP